MYRVYIYDFDSLHFVCDPLDPLSLCARSNAGISLIAPPNILLLFLLLLFPCLRLLLLSLVFGLAFCERLHVYIAASTDCDDDDGDADWGLGLRLRLVMVLGLGLRMGTDRQSIGAFCLLFLMLTRLKIIDLPCRRSMSTSPRHRSTRAANGNRKRERHRDRNQNQNRE